MVTSRTGHLTSRETISSVFFTRGWEGAKVGLDGFGKKVVK